MDWIGCYLALFGSILLATNSRYSGWGFVSYLVSNCAWLYYAAASGIVSLVIMQAGFTVTSVIGIYRWRKQMKAVLESLNPWRGKEANRL